jgi:hypothetical protein
MWIHFFEIICISVDKWIDHFILNSFNYFIILIPSPSPFLFWDHSNKYSRVIATWWDPSARSKSGSWFAWLKIPHDYRFSVTDLTESNTALELGRITISNHWLPITPFLTGNRITYSTRCWKIDHLCDHCRANTQLCRVCLEEITKKEKHQCSNMPRCAQCGGEYHSLHTQCLVIQQYCSDLKENVTRALASRKLHRNEYTNQQLAVTVKNQDFPPLGKSIIPQQSA